MSERRPRRSLRAHSARRVLAARGVHGLGERLRPREERLVFVVGSPRSGTTFLAGAIGAHAGVRRPERGDAAQGGDPRARRAARAARPPSEIRRVLERVRRLALVPGLRGVEQTPETAFVLGAALRAYPQARAVHPLRDGRDVVCSLLERGWLSAGRGGGDDAKAGVRRRARASGSSPTGSTSSRPRATRPAPPGPGAAYVTAARAAAGSGRSRCATSRSPRPELPAAIAAHLDVDPAPLARGLERFHDRSIGRFRRDLTAGAARRRRARGRAAARRARLRPVAARLRSYRSLRSFLGAVRSLGRVNSGTGMTRKVVKMRRTLTRLALAGVVARVLLAVGAGTGVRSARPRTVGRAARLPGPRGGWPRRRRLMGLGGPGIGFGGPGMVGPAWAAAWAARAGRMGRAAAAVSSPTS